MNGCLLRVCCTGSSVPTARLRPFTTETAAVLATEGGSVMIALAV